MIPILGLAVGVVLGLFLHPTVPLGCSPTCRSRSSPRSTPCSAASRARLDGIFDAKVFVISFVSNVVVAGADRLPRRPARRGRAAVHRGRRRPRHPHLRQRRRDPPARVPGMTEPPRPDEAAEHPRGAPPPAGGRPRRRVPPAAGRRSARDGRRRRPRSLRLRPRRETDAGRSRRRGRRPPSRTRRPARPGAAATALAAGADRRPHPAARLRLRRPGAQHRQRPQQLAGAREEDLVRHPRRASTPGGAAARADHRAADRARPAHQLRQPVGDGAGGGPRRAPQAIGILNGTLAAQGPGLRMIDPRPRRRRCGWPTCSTRSRSCAAPGAETMQIDGVRVGVSTPPSPAPRARCSSTARPITAPYEFLVIGSPQDMETAMNIPGGVVQRITGLGGVGGHHAGAAGRGGRVAAARQPQYASPKTGG